MGGRANRPSSPNAGFPSPTRATCSEGIARTLRIPHAIAPVGRWLLVRYGTGMDRGTLVTRPARSRYLFGGRVAVRLPIVWPHLKTLPMQVAGQHQAIWKDTTCRASASGPVDRAIPAAAAAPAHGVAGDLLRGADRVGDHGIAPGSWIPSASVAEHNLRARGDRYRGGNRHGNIQPARCPYQHAAPPRGVKASEQAAAAATATASASASACPRLTGDAVGLEDPILESI
jgi:hypothetical protein